jgi:hypothetical protein
MEKLVIVVKKIRTRPCINLKATNVQSTSSKSALNLEMAFFAAFRMNMLGSVDDCFKRGFEFENRRTAGR